MRYASQARKARNTSGPFRAVELLEPRRLLSVTLTTPLSPLTVPAGAFPSTVALDGRFDSTTIDGTTVRFVIESGGRSANLDLELFDAQTPLTVANFLRYIDTGRYNSTFFHRAVAGFVVQGGGYGFPSGAAIQKFGTVRNEFPTSPRDDQGRVNIRGTVAMAKRGGDPHSADSEFFVNVADNSANLDHQNEGFTTFARVFPASMPFVDSIANSTIARFNPPFDEVPTVNFNPAAPGAQIQQANVFYVRSAQRIGHFTFSAVSSDPSRVTAALDAGNNLVLTYLPGATGTVTVSITATDLNGAALTTSLEVTIQPAATLAVSTGGTRVDPASAAPVNLGILTPAPDGALSVLFTIRNTGSENLSLSNLQLPTGVSLVGTLPPMLVAGEQRNLTLAFSTATAGIRTGNLVFLNDGSTGTFTVPISADVRLPVTLGAPLVPGGPVVRAVTFTQGVGTGAVTATLRLSGPGLVHVGFSSTAAIARGPIARGAVTITGDALLASLRLDGTTTASSLSLTTTSRTALVDIGTVTAVGTASLASFNARGGRLSGPMTIGSTNASTAVLRAMTIGAIVNTTLSLGVNNTPRTAFTLTADRIEAATILVGYPIAAATVANWIPGPEAPALRAVSLGTLTVRSDFGTPITLDGPLGVANITGRLTGGTWDINGPVNRLSAASAAGAFTLLTAGSINSASFRGAFEGTIQPEQDLLTFSAASTANATINARSIRRISVASGMVDSFVSSSHIIETISANFLSGTRIYGGVRQLGQDTPFPAAATGEFFNDPSFIRSVTLAGRGVANAFSNSVISARNIGTLRLGRVNLAAGARNGIAADTIDSLALSTVTGQRLTLRRLNLQAHVPTLLPPPGGNADFSITML